MDFIQILEDVNPILIFFALILLIIIKSMIPFFPFPKEPVIIFAGYNFGFWYGCVVGISGYLIGAFIDYELASRGRISVDKQSTKMNNYQEKFLAHGWKALIPLRFSPITAQDVTSYASGFANLNKNHYYGISTAAFLMYAIIYSGLGAGIEVFVF